MEVAYLSDGIMHVECRTSMTCQLDVKMLHEHVGKHALLSVPVATSAASMQSQPRPLSHVCSI